MTTSETPSANPLVIPPRPALNPSLSLARAVADAVLYEGYLLYPYRASSRKNQTRWQFGMLGPPGAAGAGLGEEDRMWADCLLHCAARTSVDVTLRFLQLQSRTAEEAHDGGFRPVHELTIDSSRWLTWDEAAEHELSFGPFGLGELLAGVDVPIDVPDGEEIELLRDREKHTAGRLIRRTRRLRGKLRLSAVFATDGALDGAAVPSRLRLRAEVRNTAHSAVDKPDAVAVSFIGTHLLLSVADGDFVSLLDPPPDAESAARACEQFRCWPVLAGPEGLHDVVLLTPIILYDHPAVAEQSTTPLFDSTEIDEILTLRILTLTEDEKAEARATDPRAAAIIDSCEAMTPDDLQQLHGILRNPHALDPGARASPPPDDFPTIGDIPATGNAGETPWWNPEADASVDPGVDAVVIDGVSVARGSRVIISPKRRADAQDLFSAGKTGRVTGVHFDVDGSTHVAVVIEDDPAADLHEWYGRYLYFAPDELEPIPFDSGSRDTQHPR